MKKIAIVGAGISGLFIANLLKRNPNYQITIYEKSNSISLEEGYGVQLSINSVKLLNQIDFNKFSNNKKFNPNKINFYSNNNSEKICELDISNFNSDDCKYTTLKRSDLINFLKKDIEDLIKTDHSISNINQENKKVQLTFDNKKIFECDSLIISDGVFSKCKKLISNSKTKPKYNNTIAIRGTISNSPKIIDNKNIMLFLDSNFHQVIYPISPDGDLNFIAIMKYTLSSEELKNYSLFNNDSFIGKILENIPQNSKKFFDDIKQLRIFPVFVSNNFFEIENKNIHLIGDAFFAFPPSFAQGASQSIEGAYELFKCIENNTESDFFKNRASKSKMVNFRSKLNQFAFHSSNPFTIFFRNIFLKRLVKNKNFLEHYLGKIYKD